MTETPSERLRRRRKELGFRHASDAAKRFGWDVTTYRSHENNSRGTGVPKNAAVEYAKVYQVSLDWLMTGKDSPVTIREDFSSLGLAVQYVPVVALASLGELSSNGANMLSVLEDAPRLPVASSMPLGSQPFIIRLEDESMVADSASISFKKGDLVCFSPDAAVEPGDYCLATVTGEKKPVFRRYIEEALGVVRLEPLNKVYRTYWIDEDRPGRVIARAMLRIDEL